jgi:hypothetical protein
MRIWTGLFFASIRYLTSGSGIVTNWHKKHWELITNGKHKNKKHFKKPLGHGGGEFRHAEPTKNLLLVNSVNSCQFKLALSDNSQLKLDTGEMFFHYVWQALSFNLHYP